MLNHEMGDLFTLEIFIKGQWKETVGELSGIFIEEVELQNIF